MDEYYLIFNVILLQLVWKLLKQRCKFTLFFEAILNIFLLTQNLSNLSLYTNLSRIGNVRDRVLVHVRVLAVVLQDKVREGFHEADLFGFLQPERDHRYDVIQPAKKGKKCNKKTRILN